MRAGRDQDIDIAKGLGIFLVAAGHTPLWSSLGVQWIGPAIFSFHMPLFLFLSGLFLPVRQAFPATLRKRAIGLLVPYLLACAVFLATGEHKDWAVLFGRIGWATGQSMAWPWTPLWFLPHLFVGTLLARALVRTWNRLGLARWKWLCLFVLLLIATRAVFEWENASDFELFDREFNLLGMPWSLDLLPLSLVWLIGANVFGKDLREAASPWWSFPLYAGAAALLYWRHAWSTNFNVRTIDHLAGSSLAALLGILATLALARLLSRWTVPSAALSSLGRASLWILVSHTFLQSWTYAKLWDEAKGATPDRILLFGFLVGWCLPWSFHAVRELATRLLTARRAKDTP